jgi:hypothetical protein
VTNVEDYRREVTQRAHRRCEYCLYPQSASSTLLEIDHVIPESKGGLTELDNLALACRHICFDFVVDDKIKTTIVIPINGLKQKVLTQ